MSSKEIKGVIKKIATGLITVSAVCILAGCNDNGQASDIEEAPQSNRQEITIWSYYETPAQQAAMDNLVGDFNRSQKEYWCTWEYVPMVEFTRNLSMGISMGTESRSLPDIVVLDNPNTETFVKLDMLEPIELTDNMDDTLYYSQVIEACKYQGKYYGLPVCCNNLALYYNKDMFDEAGIPKPLGWDSFLLACEKIKDKKIAEYPFGMCAIEVEQGAFQLLPWILSENEKSDDLGGEKTVAAFEKIDELLTKGYLDRNSVSWSQIDVARKFAAKETAMVENGPWILSMLEEAGVNYGIVQMPVRNKYIGVFGGEDFCIVKGRNKEGAKAFLDYYNQDEVMTEFCRQCHVLPPKINAAREMAAQDPRFAVFEEQMKDTISRTSIAGWSNVCKKFGNASYLLFVGKGSPEESAKELTK